MTLKIDFQSTILAHFEDPALGLFTKYSNFFGVFDFWPKILLLMTPPMSKLKNLTDTSTQHMYIYGRFIFGGLFHTRTHTLLLINDSPNGDFLSQKWSIECVTVPSNFTCKIFVTIYFRGQMLYICMVTKFLTVIRL